METKGITCKIPLDLHNRISEEMREKELTVSQYIELVIREHMDGGIRMGKTRTLAFQVSEELFQRIKDYLDRYEQTYRRKLTQKEFVIGLLSRRWRKRRKNLKPRALPGRRNRQRKAVRPQRPPKRRIRPPVRVRTPGTRKPADLRRTARNRSLTANRRMNPNPTAMRNRKITQNRKNPRKMRTIPTTHKQEAPPAGGAVLLSVTDKNAAKRCLCQRVLSSRKKEKLGARFAPGPAWCFGKGGCAMDV